MIIRSKVLQSMERIGVLINKLKEQYDQHADEHAIMITAQMLMGELQQQNNASNNSYKKVSVIMPAKNAATVSENGNAVKEDFDNGKKNFPEKEKNEKTNWMFESTNEAPTLSQQKKEVYELNESIGNIYQNSLNEKLREEKTELGNVLQDTPVKDLKKAIGINDRYLFINELFRGDETMYERSIKTINSFSIFAEAEYWILRELKLKLAWSESNPVVQQFDQLVKRRFS